MAKKACVARLRKELKAFEPPPYIRAAPLEHDLQEWRFVLQGPHDSPYEGGMYQGKLRFPDEYPFKPPSIMMITPNGRFETDRRLCLSISDFHPESWIPTWSVASIINGVLSFMLEDGQTTGSIQTTLAEKHRLRDASVAWNSKDPVFRELFPELVEGKPFTPKLSAAPPSGEPQRPGSRRSSSSCRSWPTRLPTQLSSS
jgi:ubiquitin-conjugating enzyme E2 J2